MGQCQCHDFSGPDAEEQFPALQEQFPAAQKLVDRTLSDGGDFIDVADQRHCTECAEDDGAWSSTAGAAMPRALARQPTRRLLPALLGAPCFNLACSKDLASCTDCCNPTLSARMSDLRSGSLEGFAALARPRSGDWRVLVRPDAGLRSAPLLLTPDASAVHICELATGAEARCVFEDGSFARVRWQGLEGWLPLSDLTFLPK
mmetsp:Transcript_104069/g.333643  ORF Transcript_104069/g.333643 Transcript_104069/m.333643 type:complete len:203 (+) Transcript_104069:89-697(+)